MGILKSLLGGTADLLDAEDDDTSPDEERRSAMEAALDRVLAERGQQAAASRPQPTSHASGSRLSALEERRTGEERRHAELHEVSSPLERRTGDERRKASTEALRPGAFGRRLPRSA